MAETETKEAGRILARLFSCLRQIGRRAAGLLLVALIAGPLHADEEISALRLEDYRVALIANRLARADLSLCPRFGILSGMLLQHLADYRPQDQRMVATVEHLDRGPGVLAVVPDAAAAQAGLMSGDVLLAVNGAAFPAPASIVAQADVRTRRFMMRQSEELVDRTLAQGPATLRILRDGSESDIVLRPVRGCWMRIRLARSDQRNAFEVDGQIVVTTGLLSLIRSDDELAFLIGHEMSHALLGHRLGAGEALPGDPGLPGAPVPTGATGREAEDEADALGVQLMLAAGYDPDRGLVALRRLDAAHFAIGLGAHRTAGERIARLRPVIAAWRAGHHDVTLDIAH